MTIDGARILVVGGSAGIGREVGRQAAGAGASVVFAARRKDKLDEAVAAAGSGTAVELDVTDEASVTSGIDAAVHALGGPIDAVVYATGWANMSALEKETQEGWQRMFATNVIGAATVVRGVVPHLSSSGVLAVLSSSSADRRLWGMNGYGTTKAALDRYLLGLKDEHPALRVTCLRVGPTIGTEFGDGFAGDVLMDALGRWVTSGNHMQNLMSVPDISAVIVGLLGLLRGFPAVDLPSVALDPAGGNFTLPPGPDAIAKAFGG